MISGLATIQCPVNSLYLGNLKLPPGTLSLPPPPRRNAHRSFLCSTPALATLKWQEPCLTVSVSPLFSIRVVHPSSHMHQVEEGLQVRTQSLLFSSWYLCLGPMPVFGQRRARRAISGSTHPLDQPQHPVRIAVSQPRAPASSYQRQRSSTRLPPVLSIDKRNPVPARRPAADLPGRRVSSLLLCLLASAHTSGVPSHVTDPPRSVP